jgi:hypothetical protein
MPPGPLPETRRCFALIFVRIKVSKARLRIIPQSNSKKIMHGDNHPVVLEFLLTLLD